MHIALGEWSGVESSAVACPRVFRLFCLRATLIAIFAQPWSSSGAAPYVAHIRELLIYVNGFYVESRFALLTSHLSTSTRKQYYSTRRLFLSDSNRCLAKPSAPAESRLVGCRSFLRWLDECRAMQCDSNARRRALRTLLGEHAIPCSTQASLPLLPLPRSIRAWPAQPVLSYPMQSVPAQPRQAFLPCLPLESSISLSRPHEP